MNNPYPIPEEIRVQSAGAVLTICYDVDSCYALPAEYLRVYSPSAEVRGHGAGQAILQVGKHHVRISDIVGVGRYALKIIFDDGHHTGLYDWAYLYDLAIHYEAYWQDYLNRLAQMGINYSGSLDK